MPGLQDLPNELLLMILEQPTLTITEEVVFYATTSRWRKLIQNTSALRERSFLRTLTPCHSLTDVTLFIDIIVRPVPSTVWNNHVETMYEMVWWVDLDVNQLEGDSNKLNPIVQNIGDWTHLINPNFSHFEETPNAHKSSRSPRALRFRNLSELSRLLSYTTTSDASWRDILVSRYPMHDMHIIWDLGMRWSKKKYQHAPLTEENLINGDNVRMEQFIQACRTALNRLGECFVEDEQGRIELKGGEGLGLSKYLGSEELIVND